MNRRSFLAVILLCLVASTGAVAQDVRFETLDIYIDSSAPFAAWQIELSDRTGNLVIVGVENGEARAFEKAPYYDMDAVESGAANRLILASYSLAESNELPRGRTRVATVHVMVTGDTAPELNTRIVAAYDGSKLDATASIVKESGDSDD